MTDTPLTHCHTCGRELPWNRIFLGDRAYCGAECLPVKTLDILPDPRIAALEADLAEALDIILQSSKLHCGEKSPKAYSATSRRGLRLLAEHGRFCISYDENWTEGEWING